jgi:hypothetical protein
MVTVQQMPLSFWVLAGCTSKRRDAVAEDQIRAAPNHGVERDEKNLVQCRMRVPSFD